MGARSFHNRVFDLPREAAEWRDRSRGILRVDDAVDAGDGRTMCILSYIPYVLNPSIGISWYCTIVTEGPPHGVDDELGG